MEEQNNGLPPIEEGAAALPHSQSEQAPRVAHLPGNSPALPEPLLNILLETPAEQRAALLETWLALRQADPEYLRANAAQRLRLYCLFGAALLAGGSLAGLIFYGSTLPVTIIIGLLALAFLALGTMASVATGQNVSLKEFGDTAGNILRSVRELPPDERQK